MDNPINNEQHGLNNPVLIHDQLNPVLWDTETNKLLPDVREALLNIYNDFLSSNFTSNSVTIPVVDLHLLGSQAGYNYTEHSDIDLHLLVNFELLYEKDEVLQLLYQTVTRKFNSDLDVTVKGIPVELYIQDLKSVNRSSGVYSVFEDKWIQEPGQPPEIDQETLETANEIADELIAATKAVLDNRDSTTLEEVEQLINDIYVVRKQSLTEFNEFSAGNLAFKILRNTGMLDEIKELHKELRGKELSLSEQNKSQELKEDHCLECGEQVDHDEKTCPYCGSSEIHRVEDDIPQQDDKEIELNTDDIKHLYKFVASDGYVYKDKQGKSVFNLTEKQAKDKAYFANKEAEKKGSSPNYKPYLAEDNKSEEKKTMKGDEPMIKEKLKEDINSQDIYADTSAAASLTALVNSEIEAINLYTSVLETCTCEKTRVVLEEILQDEKDHINLLSNLIDSLVSDAFPTDETVEEIVQKAGMNPVPDEAASNVTVDAGTIPTVSLLSEEDNSNLYNNDSSSDYDYILNYLKKNDVDTSDRDETVKYLRDNQKLYKGLVKALSLNIDDEDLEDAYEEFGQEISKEELVKNYSIKEIYEELRVPAVAKEFANYLKKIGKSKLNESVNEEEKDDLEQKTEDLIDEVESMGYEVNDDNSFSITGVVSGYTATVTVNDDGSFSVLTTEDNGDILESFVVEDKEELFEYLSFLKSENQDVADENLEYEDDEVYE